MLRVLFCQTWRTTNVEEAIAAKTKKIRTNAKVLKQLNFFGKLPRFSVRVIASQINRQLNRFVKHMVRLEQVAFYKISAKCLPPTVFITVFLCHLRGKPRRTIRNQNYFSQKKRGHTSSCSVWLRPRPDPNSKVICTAFSKNNHSGEASIPLCNTTRHLK